MSDRLLTGFAPPGMDGAGWAPVPAEKSPLEPARRRDATRQAGLVRVRVALREAWRRYRSRQRIAQLNAHLLKDIGVSYAEAEHEANKPFWVV